MNKQAQIILTGAAGFIGSCMLQWLNEHGYENIIIADDFGASSSLKNNDGREPKKVNWQNKKYSHAVERDHLFDWLAQHKPSVDFVIHLGARTDTTEFDYSIHETLNVQYSKDIWNWCALHKVPLIYASSAATYGSGELGYNDNHDIVEKLQPLNPYGISKNEFDKWALKTIASAGAAPPFWAGLKFFNVYGPNEYHKARMASVIFHSYNQIKKDGVVKLFKSHRPDFRDGEQLRDFIYVKDVVKVIGWMLPTADSRQSTVNSGLYNLGTGKARSFIDLVKATFAGMDKKPDIIFIDMPHDIRDKYQYFTEANMQKLRDAGYTEAFYSLEDGVNDYVRNYLSQGRIW